jgi:hypothetical protein
VAKEGHIATARDFQIHRGYGETVLASRPGNLVVVTMLEEVLAWAIRGSRVSSREM